MDETITKRLHISGLTPALTANDLSKRLSTFGTVKAIDGFDLIDGLGQPRKFGYITLETTQGKLARCLNLLSGSTWKGTKLRIGEAKPDFAERLAAERQAASDEPPKKKRRQCAGVKAPDMSLVTPESVVGRGGWKVTPLGRIVRPVRMRPEHPLPPPKEDKEKRLKKKKGEDGKNKKKRVKEPDVRARRRTIDVTRWGSVHLKGMFLDMEVLGTKRHAQDEKEADVEMESEGSVVESDADVSREEIQVDEIAAEDVDETPPTKTVPAMSVPLAPATPAPLSTLSTTELFNDSTDIAAEKSHSLSLLASLFGNKADADWVGRESVGSDVDEAELAKRHQVVIDADDEDEDFEVVPMDADVLSSEEGEEDNVEVSDNAVEGEAKAPAPAPAPPPPPQTQKQQQATKLKDLFAPREEEAGFSLLGHLDLDLELDEEIPFATTFAPTEPAQDLGSSFAFPTNITSTAPQPHSLHLNPRQPLFFPLSPLPAGSGSIKARPKDILDAAKEGGWSWRDPSVGFFRTGTEEEIRKRWEEGRGELTREWKRRWREAGKVRRRRGRGGEGEGVDGAGE